MAEQEKEQEKITQDGDKNIGEKQWYIVTTYSSHENKVADNLRKNFERLKEKDPDMANKVYRIIVAEQEEQVLKDGIPVLLKDGTPKIKKRNLYPGYIFIEMVMTDDTWYWVRNTPGVTGIAGSSGGGQKPTPVTREEIEPVLKRMGVVDESMYERYNVGDLVKVIRGPLEGTEGKIIAIDKETGACKVETMFFGRATKVDVEFQEIEKI